MSNLPCTRCMIHKDNLADLENRSPMRTHESAKEAVHDIKQLLNTGIRTQAEEHMTKTGLYPVENAFWSIAHTDIYQALSFDSLHTIYLGIFGKHAFSHLLSKMTSENKAVLVQRFLDAPAYPGMKRIHKIDALSFADGEKYFAAMQQLLPYIIDLAPPNFNPLLSLLAKLSRVTMHIKMKWQTMSRITAGRAIIASMAEDLEELKTRMTDKNWAFPKMHQLVHAFDDIIRKGTDEFINCKVGENLHQGLIALYQASNKKDFISQICRGESRIMAISRIRFRLDQYAVLEQKHHASTLARIQRPPAQQEETDMPLDRDLEPNGQDSAPARRDGQESAKTRRINLQHALYCDLEGREKEGLRDSHEITRRLGYYVEKMDRDEFRDFHLKLVKFARFLVVNYTKDLAPVSGMSQANVVAALPVSDHLGIEITACHSIKHTLCSLDNQEPIFNLIRCMPQAYGSPRFDTVLAASGPDQQLRPARLHLVFEFKAHSVTWQAALISYFCPLHLTNADRTIRMKRYQETTETSIVLLHVIVRSCYMSPAPNDGEFYLNPFVSGDVDLYIRVNEMYETPP